MEPIHRFIFEIDGKVYSFHDVTIWDESSYYWFTGEYFEKKIGVTIPYYQHIRNACRFSNLLMPSKCKTTFIIGGKVHEDYSLKSMNFCKSEDVFHTPYIVLHLSKVI